MARESKSSRRCLLGARPGPASLVPRRNAPSPAAVSIRNEAVEREISPACIAGPLNPLRGLVRRRGSSARRATSMIEGLVSPRPLLATVRNLPENCLRCRGWGFAGAAALAEESCVCRCAPSAEYRTEPNAFSGVVRPKQDLGCPVRLEQTLRVGWAERRDARCRMALRSCTFNVGGGHP